jgi:Fe-S oxidoreductase
MNGEIDNKIGFNDGRDLFNYIEKEEIRACTTCNACVEACPVLINPLEIILQLRRYEILTQSSGPPDWVPMYTALENNGSPWQMTIERDDWIKELN